MKLRCIVVIGVLLVSCAWAQATFVGFEDPVTNWPRTQATIFGGVSLKDRDDGAFTNSSVSHSDPGAIPVFAHATTRPYEISGFAQHAGDNTTWQAGGSFRDQLRFGITGGGIGSLSFRFSVELSIVFENNQFSNSGDLNMRLDARNPQDLSTLLTLDQWSVDGEGNHDQTVVLSTGLIATDKYYALQFGMWGRARNGTTDFANTVTLTDVTAFDELGNELPAGSFTLTSEQDFGADPIPLPTAAWMALAALGVTTTARPAKRRGGD